MSAFPTKRDAAADLVKLREHLKDHARTFRESDYSKALIAQFPESSTADRLKQWSWGKATLLVDQPEKVDPEARDVALPILPALRAAVDTAACEVLVISPYFIPSKAAIEFLGGVAQRGVDTRVLTNSLASNDVPAVHSGYAPKREALLRGGVKLYELKPLPGGDRDRERGLTGSSSGLALHAKSLVVDRRLTFVGSVNLDPRSKVLNTEIGVLVDSPALAEQVAAFFLDASAPLHSYSVVLGETLGSKSKSKPLRWVDGEGANAKVWDHEPATSWLKRRRAELARTLPIEDLL